MRKSIDENSRRLGACLISVLLECNEETDDLITYTNILLDGGSYVDYKDFKTGNNALMLTVLKDFPNVFENILAYFPDLDARNSFGATVTHLAASSQNSFYLRTLMSKKANINASDRVGNRPINYAIKALSLSNIDLLMKNNCANNFLNNFGLSIYDEANLTGNEEVIASVFTPEKKNEGHMLKRIVSTIINDKKSSK